MYYFLTRDLVQQNVTSLYNYEFSATFCIHSLSFLVFLKPTLAAAIGQIIECRSLELPNWPPFFQLFIYTFYNTGLCGFSPNTTVS